MARRHRRDGRPLRAGRTRRAPEEALDAALDVAGPGVDVGQIGAAVEEVIEGYGYNPVGILPATDIGHWEQHTSPNIPNREVAQGATLDVGDVVAIEPFATDGTRQGARGVEDEIYSLERPLGSRPAGAQVLDRSPRSTEHCRSPPAGSTRRERRWRFAA